MSKKYRLKRDLPDYKAGMIFKWDGDKHYKAEVPCENMEYGRWPPQYVENNPDWFEEVIDRIKVGNVWFEDDRANGGGLWAFDTNKQFHPEKLSAIKSAIETVLNKNNDKCDSPAPTYTQSQLEDAFNAGRENCLYRYGLLRYDNFQDYLKTLQP